MSTWTASSTGQRKIIIVPDEPGVEAREYSLPRGVHVNVQEGERVRAGEPLMDGPSNPNDTEFLDISRREQADKFRFPGDNVENERVITASGVRRRAGRCCSGSRRRRSRPTRSSPARSITCGA